MTILLRLSVQMHTLTYVIQHVLNLWFTRGTHLAYVIHVFFQVQFGHLAVARVRGWCPINMSAESPKKTSGNNIITNFQTIVEKCLFSLQWYFLLHLKTSALRLAGAVQIFIPAFGGIISFLMLLNSQ